MKNVRITTFPLALIVIAATLAAAGCLNKDEKDVKGRAVATLTSNQLCAIYEKGPSQAKRKYTDKIIKVKGTLHRKETDVMTQVFLTMRSRSGDDVQCFFGKKWAKKLLKLEEGDKIAVKGLCVGRNIKVQLKGCVLISP